MSELHIAILAAGQGKRMKSAQPKVLHPLMGRSLIEHVLRTAEPLHAHDTTLVVGHGGDQVRAALAQRTDLRFVVQAPQLGTGHALLQTEPVLKHATGSVLLLYADVPLLTPQTLQRLLETHAQSGAAMTVLTAQIETPHGYGRIVRDASRRIARIVEERDASADERAIREINSGIYVLSLDGLFDALRHLATDNAQGEYYLTDLVSMYRQRGLVVETLAIDDPSELRGVNSRADLADLARILRDRKSRALMLDGVTLDDPQNVYVDDDVRVGMDTTLGPGVILTGTTTIGERCRIHAGARITDSQIADDVTVLDRCVIVESVVGPHVSIGPFAHLRPGSTLEEGSRVGNFVELKKTTLGARSKANHLAYLGDATVGADANIGAGVITCNYDGVHKHKTVIGDGVFVGSDSQLVAPITIGPGAYVAAGSSITEDVPPGALAIARSRQTNKAGWAAGRAKARKQESR